MHKILVVEDDDNLRESLVDNLELEGYTVYSQALVQDTMNFLSDNQVDLIVLDVMLPDGNGYDLCRWINQNAQALVLMLTARSLEQDVVEGFISGADDYVSKPYRLNELLLRIKAILRRSELTQVKSETKINGFIINWQTRQVLKQNTEVHLTKTAFNILHFLYLKLGQVCSRNQILDQVWGKGVYVDNRTIDNFVSNLKKQLELTDTNSDYKISTVRGVGYRLDKDT